MKSDLPVHRPPEEKFLYGVWARRGFDPRRLRTVDGARTQVVFPGRRNGGAGPDFLDASVDVEGRGLLRGDVEIHVRARDWMSHGHHRDPAYNGVVLHVVWEADSSGPSGRTANTSPRPHSGAACRHPWRRTLGMESREHQPWEGVMR